MFTALTTSGGNTVPWYEMPPPNAPLASADASIVDGASIWDALGSDSGTCFATRCGYTDWIKSIFDIVTAGTYKLKIGVTNWTGTDYNSGMAFAGAEVGDVIITPPVDPAPVPLPTSALLLGVGVGVLGVLRRRKKGKA